MMRRVLIGTALLALLSPARVTAGTDAAAVRTPPWSGYWWQHRSGGLTGPLGKYDQLYGTEAAEWERQAHVSEAAEAWFGHCHAWSASSVIEPEPTAPREVDRVRFSIGDLKGLLAACHAQDVSNYYGDRFGDGSGSEDPSDLLPEELWRLLQLYIKQVGVPLVIDVEDGAEVWNHPAYQYSVDFRESGDGRYDAEMELLIADDGVPPDFVGTQPILRTYTFSFRMIDGAIVQGSSRWTGTSVDDHPDFAWYPYVAVAENPGVNADRVSQVVGFAVGQAEAPPEGPGRLRIDDPGTDGPDRERPGGDVERPRPDEERPDGQPGRDGEGPGGGGAQPEDGGVPSEDPRPSRPEPGPGPVRPTDDLLGPYELVDLVLCRTSDFTFDMFLDRGDGGRYRVGEPITISLRSGEGGFIYLYDVDAEGNLALIYPRPGDPNQIDAGTLYDVPVRGEAPVLLASGVGQHQLKAVVTERPIRISCIGSGGDGRRGGDEGILVVPPSTEAKIRSLLSKAHAKGFERPEGPGKIGRFAQDMSVYYVVDEKK